MGRVINNKKLTTFCLEKKFGKFVLIYFRLNIMLIMFHIQQMTRHSKKQAYFTIRIYLVLSTSVIESTPTS